MAKPAAASASGGGSRPSPFASDDFDFPMPQRATNWTLPASEAKRRVAPASSAAAAAGATTRPSHHVADIDGAKAGTTAMFRSYKFSGKPDLFDVKDIAGSSPTRQIPMAVKKDNTRNLCNSDIEHSFPESKLFSTPRVVNPLDPSYPLPHVRVRMPTPPTQRCETLKISDIPGTSAKPPMQRTTVSNPLDYSDVSLPAAKKRQSASLALVTQDITSSSSASDARQRTTPINPLDPVYVIRGPSGVPSPATGSAATSQRALIVVGPVDGSKPKGLPPARTGGPMFSLTSADIAGASPGNSMPYPKQRREWKATCDISDIDTKGKRVLH